VLRSWYYLITLSTRLRHWSYLLAQYYTYSNILLRNIHFSIIISFVPRYFKWFLLLFSSEHIEWVSLLSSACYVLGPFRPIWLNFNKFCARFMLFLPAFCYFCFLVHFCFSGRCTRTSAVFVSVLKKYKMYHNIMPSTLLLKYSKAVLINKA